MRPFLISTLFLIASTPAMAADTRKQLLGIQQTEFEWTASASAPLRMPMKVIAANLNYPGGGQYVTASSSTASGWGEPDGSISGKKQLPPKILDILFFSYTEDQFYRGTFDLPYEKILKLFQGGYDSPKARRHVTYTEAVVGVAPGGVVAVWLRGIDRQTEVFYGKAIKVNLPWSTLTSNTKMAREAYIEDNIKYYVDTPEAYAALKKNGPPLGLWDRYRTRYAWQPVFVNMPLRDDLIQVLAYFTGEYEHLYYPLDAAHAGATRPVPSELHFVWKTPPTMSYNRSVILRFNESEIFTVFDKLSVGNKPLKLELRIAPLPNGKHDFTIWVTNDKESVELKQTDVKHYSAKR